MLILQAEFWKYLVNQNACGVVFFFMKNLIGLSLICGACNAHVFIYKIIRIMIFLHHFFIH